MKETDSSHFYQMLFEENPLPMWIFDLETLAFLAANNAAVAHYGYSREEFLALSLKDIRPAEDVQFLLDNFPPANTQLKSVGIWRHTKKNGKIFSAEILATDFLFNGRPARLGIVNDVTERLRAEQSLLENQRLLANIISSAMDAIITVDAQQRIVLFNAAAEKMFGYTATEMMGSDIAQLIPNRFRSGHHQHIERFGQTHETKRTMGRLGAISGLRADGKEFPIEASISQVETNGAKFYTVILRDISEKKKLEMQFLRAQRMESIGTLAGGIAHDLNNILSPILMAIQMLQLKVTDDLSQRMLEVMRMNAERGGDLVKQILSFARGVSGERIAVQPKHLLKEIAKILKETLPKSIEVKLQVDPELSLISGDATQLQQILMNLCVNARDAMPDGGSLNIEAKDIEIDATYAEMLPSAKPGSFVRIAVSDTGTGIAPDHLNRIFDPFFTTKEIGKGTGLGLSTVQGIVKGHGGFLNVYSEVGKGTVFTVYLPALAAAQLAMQETPALQLPGGNGELILVVDDELAIREITRGTLESFNYQILTASDGAEAVALFAQHRASISVVLTDMMMPVMDGPAMIQALRRIDPAIKVIASSGFSDTGKAAEATALGVSAFLHKPYTAEKLLKTLAELLQNQK